MCIGYARARDPRLSQENDPSAERPWRGRSTSGRPPAPHRHLELALGPHSLEGTPGLPTLTCTGVAPLSLKVALPFAAAPLLDHASRHLHRIRTTQLDELYRTAIPANPHRNQRLVIAKSRPRPHPMTPRPSVSTSGLPADVLVATVMGPELSEKTCCGFCWILLCGWHHLQRRRSYACRRRSDTLRLEYRWSPMRLQPEVHRQIPRCILPRQRCMRRRWVRVWSLKLGLGCARRW
jgi:hypothetical protein